MLFSLFCSKLSEFDLTVNKILRTTLYWITRFIFRNKRAIIPLRKANPKILIYRCDAIGDYIVTTPAIKLIKERFPGSVVDMIVSHRNHDIAKQNPSLRNVYLFDESLKSALTLRKRLRKENYDICFTFFLFKTTKIGTLLNIMLGNNVIKTAVEHKRRIKEYYGFFNVLVPVERNRESMVVIQSIIVSEILGFSFSHQELRYELPVTEEAKSYVSEYLHENNIKGKYIIYNISAGNPNRMWTEEKHIRALKLIFDKYPEIIIILIAVPKDKSLAEKISSNFPCGIYLFPVQENMVRIIALIDTAHFLISPDTAIIHVASALGKPVLGLYTTLTAFLTEWMPFGTDYEMVLAEDKKALESISEEDFIHKFNILINRIS